MGASSTLERPFSTALSLSGDTWSCSRSLRSLGHRSARFLFEISRRSVKHKPAVTSETPPKKQKMESNILPWMRLKSRQHWLGKVALWEDVEVPFQYKAASSEMWNLKVKRRNVIKRPLTLTYPHFAERCRRLDKAKFYHGGFGGAAGRVLDLKLSWWRFHNLTKTKSSMHTHV